MFGRGLLAPPYRVEGLANNRETPTRKSKGDSGLRASKPFARGVSGLFCQPSVRPISRDGDFMQVPEGPEAAAESRLRAIEKDPRHRGIMPLFRSGEWNASSPNGQWGIGN
jgi:hypothetical protein